MASAQPTISSGFVSGIAAINGTTYTHTGNIGTGNYQYVCASGSEPHFFASSFTTNYLYYIDVASSTIVDSFPATMFDITASDTSHMLFAVGSSDAFYRFNTATKSFMDSLSLPGLWRVRERPGTKEVWGTAIGQIYVVDYTSGLVSTPMSFPPVSQVDAGVSFTTGGSLAYISCTNTNKLYKIDAAAKSVLDSAALPSGTFCALVSQDSSKVFVSAPNSFVIYVYNAGTLSLEDSISTDTREPFMLYRHPARQEIWAVNHFKDSVTVYDENTYAQLAAFDVSSSPFFLAFASGATGVRNISPASAGVIVFPNPASKTLNISMPDVKPRSLLLYDAYGRCLRHFDTDTKLASFDVSGIVAGTYFIAIQQDGKTIKTLSWTKE
jgi:hypothetical protein